MTLDLTQAFEALNTTVSTSEALRALVAEVNVNENATGTVTVAYSGTVDGTVDGIKNRDIARSMAAADSNIRIIDKTAASILVESRGFQTKVAEAYGVNPVDYFDNTFTSPAKSQALNFLYGGTNSANGSMGSGLDI